MENLWPLLSNFVFGYYQKLYPIKQKNNVYVSWFYKNPYVKTKKLIFLNY